MIFRIITDRMPGNTILDTCNRMIDKYGTDAYIDMIHEGFDVPFSKYRREFWKALVESVIKRKK